MRRIILPVITLSTLFLGVPISRSEETKTASLDDLKKLNITCFIPAYLPKDFKFKKANITYEDNTSEGGQTEKMATYDAEWSNPRNSKFTIESAWEGIGDRNIME